MTQKQQRIVTSPPNPWSSSYTTIEGRLHCATPSLPFAPEPRQQCLLLGGVFDRHLSGQLLEQLLVKLVRQCTSYCVPPTGINRGTVSHCALWIHPGRLFAFQAFRFWLVVQEGSCAAARCRSARST